MSDSPEEFLQRHLQWGQGVTGPTATRREALALYRQVLRAARLFDFADETGQPWRRRIEQSAREEFEQGRHAQSGEEAAKMVVDGQKALEEVVRRLSEKMGNPSSEPEHPHPPPHQ